MVLTLNGAGGSLADPILRGLPLKLAIGVTSFDAAVFNDAWIEQTAGFPGTTGSIKASVSPSASILTAGIGTGTYNDTTKRYALASVSGLIPGDRLYMSHPGMTSNFVEIASVFSATNEVTIVGNPLNGSSRTGISYQVAWSYQQNAGTTPMSSNSAGVQNFAKATAADGASNPTNFAQDFYVRDAPAGASFISIGNVTYEGGNIATLAPSLSILGSWPSRGGISHLELVAHSSEAVNDFRWSDTTTTEKAIGSATSLLISSGDGIKYGRILLKSKSGGGSLGVDLSVNLDTTGPSLIMQLFGA